MRPLWLALALLAPCGAAFAAFDDAPESARSAAMAGAMTALHDDPVASLSNPAAIAPLIRPGLSLNYLRQFDLAVGKADQDRFGFASAIPVNQEILNGAFNVSYIFNQRRNFGSEKTAALGYAARSVWEGESGVLDLGGNLKFLANDVDGAGKSGVKPTIDLGGLLRIRQRYAVGLSFLNLTRPAMPNPVQADRAPAIMKLGFSEAIRGFLIALDITTQERTAGNNGATTIAGGLEQWWATSRYGSFAARGGLRLGTRNKIASAGLGWRILGGETSYALSIPMQGANIASHAVNFSFRFGAANPEEEYERVLKDEMRYRRDLTQALESSEAKQWRLGEELSRLREELDLLRDQLADKTASEATARRRAAEIEARRKEAEERFRSLREEQKRLAERSVQTMFDEDWSAYIKLKLGGAPDAVLVDNVKRILREYKDKGVDLSTANQELVRLLRAR